MRQLVFLLAATIFSLRESVLFGGTDVTQSLKSNAMKFVAASGFKYPTTKLIRR